MRAAFSFNPPGVMLAALLAAGCATSGGRTVARAPDPPPLAAMVGMASYYGAEHHGQRTASGERYDMKDFTAAHPTLPFGTRVRVTELAGGRSVVVRINDRGPFKRGRIIDVSRRAAAQLGMLGPGTARVRLEVLGDIASADER